MAPAMPVPWICGPLAAAERVEIVGDGVGELGMFGVDAGIDHRDRDIGAVRQSYALLAGGASPARIARDRPRPAPPASGPGARSGSSAAANARCRRRQIRAAPSRKAGRRRCGTGRSWPRSAGKFSDETRVKTVAARKLVGLGQRQRAVDLGHEFVGEGAQVRRRPVYCCPAPCRHSSLPICRRRRRPRSAAPGIRRRRRDRQPCRPDRGSASSAHRAAPASDRSAPRSGRWSTAGRDRRADSSRPRRG